MNIILCGLPGSGKTTVGKLLAEQLQCPFFDTDILLENHYQKKTGLLLSCREIAKKEGEQNFRLLEAETLRDLKALGRSVIATGGGILTYSVSANLLQSMGTLIYLKASPELILERLLKQGVPLPVYLDPTKDPLISYQIMYEKRRPLYESFCQFTVETDRKTPEEIVKNILFII